MIKIRKGCFETNSSSVHAMVLNKKIRYSKYDYEYYVDFIAANGKKLKGDTLIIKPGSFGWENKVLFSPDEKASYLVTSAMLLYRFDEFKEKISTYLSEEKINFKFKNQPSELTYKDSMEYADPNYYKKFDPTLSDEEIKKSMMWNLFWINDILIDHFNEDNAQEDLVNWCLESKAHLFNFLFGDSFIWLGNDNDFGYPSRKYINQKRYKVIIKGN